MALPGLDTSEISFIAFWNFIDNGGTEIDPSETTSAMDTSQEYNNGVDGVVSVQFNHMETRSANVRVKDDGWIIAWFDRTATYGLDVGWGADLHGPVDMMNDWTYEDGNINTTQHSLERVVNDLYNALSNSTNATYNPSDVGVYDYANETATTLTQAGIQTNANTTQTMDIQPTAGTTLHRVLVTGVTGADTALTVTWAPGQENVDIASGGGQLGTRNALSQGEITAGETVSLEISSNDDFNRGVKGSILLVWS